MKTYLVTGAAMAALFSTHALAQHAPAPDVLEGVTEVDAVTVATRSLSSLDKVGSSVAVLTLEDIQSRQATVVTDLLAQTPGVSFTRNGGPGAVASVSIRGAEAHHTVVLIDGVKLNDPSSTQGGFNFGNLLVGDIARIEVLRGAQSTLWGSQAIGGVVNIITTEPTQGLGVDGSLEGGERGTGYLRLGMGGGNDRASFRIAGSVYRTDGFSAYAPGTEDDGYRNEGLSGRGNLKLTETLSLDVRAVYSSGENEFDAFNRDSLEFGHTNELVAYAGLNAALLDGRFKNRLGFAYTDTDRVNFNPANPFPGISFLADGQNERIEYQGAFAIKEAWTATFGAETETAEYATESPSPSFPTPQRGGEATINTLYGQLQAEVVPGLTLTGGLRRDDHDTFGGETVGQASAAWSLNDGATILRASFGQGFRAPGLYELFSEYGNANLEPETVDSWDASLSQRLWDGRVALGLTYFEREADNEINYFSCFGVSDPLCTVSGTPRFGYYANVLQTEAKGVELTAEYRPTKAFALAANATFQSAEFASGPNNGNQLIRRPEEMANLLADYVWPMGLKTGVSVRYVGEVFANAANTVRLESYTLVDVRASYPVNDAVELFGRVENAFDEEYQTVPNFGTAGRGAFAGVRAKF